MADDNPAEEVVEPAVETVEEEVPAPVPDPDPAPVPDPDDTRPGWVDEIIEKIGEIAQASPVTEPAEQVMDETPVKKPWTHRGFGRG